MAEKKINETAEEFAETKNPPKYRKVDESRMNIYQKLAKIREMTEVVVKNKSGYNYKYTSIDEILARVTAGMKKYGVSLIPLIDHSTITVDQSTYQKIKFTKDGTQYNENVNEMVVKGNIWYRWLDDETGEAFDVPWFITGSSADPSQSFGGALTYGLRYFLLHYFQIATLDDSDPDSWKGKQKEAEMAEEKQIADAIIEKVDTLCKEKMTAENKDALIKVIKSVVKINGKASANYAMVTEPQMASALLEKVTEFFKNEKGGEK